MITNKLTINIILVAFIFFFTPLSVTAVHKGAGDLTCGSCHTMHNSQGRESLGGLSGGSLVLLRGPVKKRSEMHKFCLQCHGTNGTQAGINHAPRAVVAPKVYASGTWNVNKPYNEIGAGGDFYWEIDSSWNTQTPDRLGRGHSLGLTDILPPGGDRSIRQFSCTSCHDHHGANSPTDEKTNIFRNLWVDVKDAGENAHVKFNALESEFAMNSFVGGVTALTGPSVPDISSDPWVTYFGDSERDEGGEVIWPVYRNSLTGNTIRDTANSNSYGSGWDDKANNPTMSLWCASCHDAWHEDTAHGHINQAHLMYSGISSHEHGGSSSSSHDKRKKYKLQLGSRRHAANSQIPKSARPGCADDCHKSILDRSNYDRGLIVDGKGLPVTTNNMSIDHSGGYGSGGRVYYLPKNISSSVDFTGKGRHRSDEGKRHKVFCLSCHFAHGGPYYDALRWNYTKFVTTGDQDANTVEKKEGCQLCHNRGASSS